MHPTVRIFAAKVVLTPTQSLFRWTWFAYLATWIPALRRFQVLTEATHTIVIHPLIVFIANSTTTTITTLHRVRIPVDIRGVAGNLVCITIRTFILYWFGFCEHFWDSMPSYIVRILHVSIPPVFRMFNVVLVLYIVNTVPRVMRLWQS